MAWKQSQQSHGTDMPNTLLKKKISQSVLKAGFSARLLTVMNFSQSYEIYSNLLSMLNKSEKITKEYSNFPQHLP